jgi:Rhodopsin-like GPCR transmembrane domain
MLLLMGKGFTITRGRISTGGSIKIAIFMTLYSVIYAVLFFYQAAVSICSIVYSGNTRSFYSTVFLKDFNPQ